MFNGSYYVRFSKIKKDSEDFFCVRRSKISTSLYSTPAVVSATAAAKQQQQQNFEIELRELTEWVIRKEIQLPVISTSEDLPNLEVQMVRNWLELY